MTREEAKNKLDFLKKSYQKLIDEKVDSGKLVGDGVRGEWKAETPLDEVYKNMIEALDIAIKELEQETCEDCISRQAVLKAIDEKAWEFCDYLIRNGRNDEQKPVSLFADNLRECVGEDLPPVMSKSETVTEFADRCRECGAKYGKLLKQKFCEDVVSRRAVYEIINDAYFLKLDDGAALQESVRQLPPVTPQPKMGRWERDQFTNQPTCSACGYKVFGGQTRYCPNCGQKKMQEVEE